jgi:hypothetical protein
MPGPLKERHLMPGNALGDRSQPGRGEDLKGHPAEGEPRPVVEGLDGELRAGTLAEGDDGAGLRRQLGLAARKSAWT